MHSIRARLIIRLSTLFLLLWTVVTVAIFLESRHEVEEIFDAQLAQSAAVLAWLGTGENGPTQIQHQLAREVYGHPYEKKIAFQIWHGDKLILRSANAPRQPMAERDGFTSRHIDNGIPWRVFAMATDVPGYRIMVGERDDVREELVNEITASSLYPLSLLLPLIILLVWVGVGRGLEPLQRLAREVEERSSNNLAPVPAEDVPQEVLPLTRALNRLFTRVGEALERERRFTADAAHELRTPLASIKTQAQVASREDNDTQRHHALAQIVSGVDRATHLVEQLLTLARFDPEEAVTPDEAVDLRRLAGETVATLDRQAMEKHIQVTLEEGPTLYIQGQATALGVMLRNLLDNALRYTPTGGEVHIALGREEGRPCLSITDTGPGISDADREHLFERFYRGEATQHTPGSGLGLSIVQRIAELHGARLRFTSPSSGRGTRVVVCFPPESARGE